MGAVTKSFDLVKAHGPLALPCNECARSTQHSVVTEYRETGVEDCGGGNSVDWTDKHQIIQCLGCQTISYRRASRHSEDWDFDNDGNVCRAQTIIYFPTREAEVSRLNRCDLPVELQFIHEETIKAIQQDQGILAAVGIRTILEATCKSLGITTGNLKKKIDELSSRGKVTPDGAKLLHVIRDAGNDAAHSAKRLPTEQLLLAMRIVDHLLEGTYVIPDQMEKLFPTKKAEEGPTTPTVP